jgi:hypothetical protein
MLALSLSWDALAASRAGTFPVVAFAVGGFSSAASCWSRRNKRRR